ncbi:MAG: hypothetical protein K0B15_03710 [Lentimicrobium sp.]|nr:hypothetical protein [Lentimicrobium sp.]
MSIRTFFLLLLIAGLLFSCSKDQFPDEFSIQGTWIEKTENSFKVEIEFRSQNRAFLRKFADTPVDSLKYRLDKSDELLLFLPDDFPDGNRSTHKLTYSQKNDELTIAGLFPSQQNESSTVFVRK